MKSGFHLWMLKPKSSQSSGCTHIHNVYQRAGGNCFLGQERSADGGIDATRDHNVRSVLWNTKKICRAIQNDGLLTSGVVFLHDVLPATAARTWELLEHFRWELFDHPPCSHDLTPSDYHLFTSLKNWLRSLCFNSKKLMEGVKMWLSSQAADFFDTGIKKLIPWYKCFNSGGDFFFSRCLFC
jgi:hypothetical protein